VTAKAGLALIAAALLLAPVSLAQNGSEDPFANEEDPFDDGDDPFDEYEQQADSASQAAENVSNDGSANDDSNGDDESADDEQDEAEETNGSEEGPASPSKTNDAPGIGVVGVIAAGLGAVLVRTRQHR